MGEGLGLGVGLGLGNHIAFSTRGVIIWQGVENGHNTGVVPNSDPCQIITPLVLVGVRVKCGGGVRIRQSDSDFNERGNNLAGVENGHNHLCSLIWMFIEVARVVLWDLAAVQLI